MLLTIELLNSYYKKKYKQNKIYKRLLLEEVNYLYIYLSF